MATRIAQLEQTVRDLAAGGGGGGPRRGGNGREQRGQRREQDEGGGGAGARTRAGNDGTSSRGRPGDWACPSCAFFPCYARATRCFKCKAPRHGGQGGGGAGGSGAAAAASAPGRLTGGRGERPYLGPVGAGGSRPMLGRRDQRMGQARDECPSVRVPGASVAARMEEERRRGQAADSEGFQPVQRGAAATGGTGAAVGERADGGQAQFQPTPVRNSWAALSEEDNMDEDGMDDHDVWARHDDYGGQLDESGEGDTPAPQQAAQGDADADDDDDHEGAVQDVADAAQLRREWQALCNAARVLDAQRAPQSLVAAAREQRDAAEARWKAARAPKPLFKRLKWAEADLREAEAKERQHRADLQRHVEEAARRTKELEERLATAVARSDRRRAAIAALHAEGAPQPHRNWTAGQAATVAATGIAKDVAPALAAVIARMASPLGEDTVAIRRELEACAQRVGYVEEMLREATAAADSTSVGGPIRFDISGGEAEGKETGAEGGGTASKGSEGGAGHGGPPPAAAAVPRWTKPAPNMPWKKLASSSASPTAAAAAPATAMPAACAPSAQAVEEARRLLQAHAALSPTPAHPTTNLATGIGEAGGGGAAAADQRAVAVAMAGAGTNDLAEAARRQQAAAHLQVLQAHQQQQRMHQDEQQRQQDEVQRQQREGLCKEEMEKHHRAIQQAAAAQAEKEAKEKADLLASMPPQERARAEAAHAQMAAVGAHAFGTQAAAEVAGLVHQQSVQEAAQGAAQAGEDVDVEHLMAMSPEEFGRWGQDRQAAGW